MSLRLRLANLLLRRLERPQLARIGPLEARRRFERMAPWFRDPPFALYLPGSIGGVPVLRVRVLRRSLRVPVRPRPELLLYLHGGGHIMGSPRTHRAMVARLCALTGLPAVLPDLRLAPEHPFPAALEDAAAVWHGLRRLYPAEALLLGGDSAGGGLALALLARLLAAGERPAALVAFAPWTDLTASGASIAENAARDTLLPVSRLAELRDLYLAGADPRDPGASPLFADFPGCPPVHLQVGTGEILRDDSLRMAQRLQGFGAEVEVNLTRDTPHVVAMGQGWLPEADAVLARTAAFIRSRLPALPPAGS